jgi:hypothetical protein
MTLQPRNLNSLKSELPSGRGTMQAYLEELGV